VPLLASETAARSGTAGAGHAPVNGLGVSLPADWLDSAAEEKLAGRRLPDDWRSPAPDAPLYVRTVISPAVLDEPDRFAALLEELQRRNLIPILVLEPPAPMGAGGRRDEPGFDLSAWLEKLDRLLSAHPVRPLLVQVLDRPSRRATPRLYAYLVKQTATSVRAVEPRAFVATGPIEDLSDLPALQAAGIGPYVDAIALGARLPEGAAVRAARRAFPGTRLWLDGAGAGGVSVMHQAGRAFTRAVSLVLAAPGYAPAAAELAAWRRLFSPSAVVVPVGFARVRALGPDGRPRPPGQVVELEAREEGGRFVLLFGPSATGPVELQIRGPRVGVAWLRELVTGEETIGGSCAWEPFRGPEGEELRAGVSRVTLRPAATPAVVRLGLFGAAPPLAEAEEVREARELTVEEIIARHRQVQARQDRRLRTLTADARIEYHFRLANFDQTFDVTTLNRYLQDGGTAVYEERELYINGALWRGAKSPDLPFVLPERVTEVPLDLRLDQRYEYRLEGRQEVGGRSAYVVAFTPLPTDESVYRGKAWIDTEEFTKLKMEAVELNVALPVISNRVSQVYEPVEVAEQEWWLRTSVEGQMVFTALGRNVVLERELAYSGFSVNPPSFTAELEEIYVSPYEVLQETPAGFQRLKKTETENGQWAVREPRPGDASVSRLLVGGVNINEDLEPSFPFVGVNYFNFDYRGTGTQLDVAWAGPLLTVFWADPSLGGTRTILAADARLNPLGRTNRRLQEGDGIDEELKPERVEVTDQTVSAIVSYPVGVNHTLQTRARLDYLRFERESKTADTFTIPSDTLEGSLALRWVYTRSGWRLDFTTRGVVRSKWEFWGKPDGTDYDPDDDRYARASLVLNKSVYPRKLDRLGFRLSLFEGENLDRFSMFNLGGLGEGGISGYGNSGIRFHRGAILDLNYSLSLSRRTQLDFALNHGRFKNEDDFGDDVHWATGASTAVSFSGPGSTLIRVRVSGPLGTSLEDPDGSVGLRAVFFRTFDRWFWQR
jgi:hypothetical protein